MNVSVHHSMEIFKLNSNKSAKLCCLYMFLLGINIEHQAFLLMVSGSTLVVRLLLEVMREYKKSPLNHALLSLGSNQGFLVHL